jgi:phosphosulfolactate phosphohydrolase-like enzyme
MVDFSPNLVLGDDLKVCAEVDSIPILPTYSDGVIKAV